MNFIKYDKYIEIENNLDDAISLFAKSRNSINSADYKVLKELHLIKQQMTDYKFKYLI